MGEVVIDAENFVQNKCSPNARKIHKSTEVVEFTIWFDKHYYIRHQHGDEAGKRDGIEINAVRNLITIASKHLLFYLWRLKTFTFINFDGNHLRIALHIANYP